MEVDLEDSGSIGRFLLFSSLSSLRFLWISARYKWRRHGFYHLPLEVDFPVHRIRREVAAMAPIGRGTYADVRRRTHLILSFFMYIYMLQPRRSADKEGDDVMAVPGALGSQVHLAFPSVLGCRGRVTALHI